MVTPAIVPETNFSIYEYEYIFEAEENGSTLFSNSTNLANTNFSTNFSCYRSDELELLDDRVQIVLISVYALTAALSLVGNLLVIAFQLTPGGTCARSALRQQLVSLAVADLILGVFCPAFAYSNLILRKWVYPRWLCPVAQGAQLLAVFVNTTSLTLIGLDRYMATVRPFSALHRFSRAHAGRARLLLVWLLGAVYAAIPLRYMDIRPISVDDGDGVYESHVICYFNAQPFTRRLFMNVNLVLTFILPTIGITACYLAIARKIRADDRAIESAVHCGEEKGVCLCKSQKLINKLKPLFCLQNSENGNTKKGKPTRNRMKVRCFSIFCNNLNHIFKRQMA